MSVDGDADALTDEQEARSAREHYRETGLPNVDADSHVAPHLGRDERVLGGRAHAGLARIDETTHQAIRDEGPLYVTNRRLLHLGSTVTSVDLEDIAELAMADDRLLVTISGARGLMLDVPEPRQFRVLLAAARSALRS
jgi:hypothetical protein